MVYALRTQGEQVERHRGRTLMRSAGLRPRWRPKFIATTHSRHDLPVAPNVLQRQFDVGLPDRPWVSDIS